MLRWSVLSVLLLVAAPDVSKEAIRKLARELSPDVPVEWQGRLESVLLYHFRSKHFLDVQASLPGELDWSSQPSPWRSYDGAPSVRLPCSLAPLEAALRPVPLSRESLGAFLRLGAGLSAWKSYDGLHMPRGLCV
ncbi:unnamed protein product [Symbiodinium natans]|uniref:Uncharacterized protein n=1 Tax=Symbiodinium natans TaxID=878477 RepID=A0A812P8C5_9DINO|nr:unnamed protein product [Symbiodinium natans]